MGYVNLENIKIKKLEEISVEGGNVIKGIKLSDANFYGFGEVYFSIINNVISLCFSTLSYNALIKFLNICYSNNVII